MTVMGDSYNINTGGGNFVGSVHGSYVQGDSIVYQNEDSIDLNQGERAIIVQIEELVASLRRVHKMEAATAQTHVANALVKQAKGNENSEKRLVSLSKWVATEASSGLVGDAAAAVVKLALGLLCL